MNAGSNIRYIRFETPSGIGYGCFAITWERDQGKFIHYKIGAAFCNPKDEFNKGRAKIIAKGRLSRNNIAGIIASTKDCHLLDEDFDLILQDIFNIKKYIPIPHWAYKSFSRNKYLFTLSSNRIK